MSEDLPLDAAPADGTTNGNHHHVAAANPDVAGSPVNRGAWLASFRTPDSQRRYGNKNGQKHGLYSRRARDLTPEVRREIADIRRRCQEADPDPRAVEELAQMRILRQNVADVLLRVGAYFSDGKDVIGRRLLGDFMRLDASVLAREREMGLTTLSLGSLGRDVSAGRKDDLALQFMQARARQQGAS